jgi:uncharacterized membrane protein YhaH (DUF805 family)
MSKPVLEDLFKFSGRRNRQSYILVSLAQLGAIFLLSCLAVAGMALIDAGLDPLGWILFVAMIVGSLALIVSGWAVGSQRVRDTGYSGVWILLILLPYIGWVFSLALWFIPSTPGENKYGPSCTE